MSLQFEPLLVIKCGKKTQKLLLFFSVFYASLLKKKQVAVVVIWKGSSTMSCSVLTGTKSEDSKWLYEWSSTWLPFLWSEGLNQQVCRRVVHTSAGVAFVFSAAKAWGIVSYRWKEGWTLLGMLRSSLPTKHRNYCQNFWKQMMQRSCPPYAATVTQNHNSRLLETHNAITVCHILNTSYPPPRLSFWPRF